MLGAKKLLVDISGSTGCLGRLIGINNWMGDRLLSRLP